MHGDHSAGSSGDVSGDRSFDVAYLTRVEGEGSLHVRLQGSEVVEARLKIFEAPRYFERLCVGRAPQDVIDIVARICGICPVAYQMSAVHAFERLFGVGVHPEVRRLRTLMYCGEWIESHALHVYLLHAPDFLGYPSAVDMARDHRDLVQGGLTLKKFGNHLLSHLGGRPVHPVSVRVGGFSRVPRRSEIDELRRECRDAVDLSEAMVDFVAGLDAPQLDREALFVALTDPHEYPMNHGEIAATDGTRVPTWAWGDAFEEMQVPETNAHHARTRDGRTYLVGPAARITLNRSVLHPRAAAALDRLGLAAQIAGNPHWSIAARAVETLHAACTAAEILEGYEAPDRPYEDAPPVPGVAAWATEAPRGILYHRYVVGEDGLVRSAQIVPPTSQNQGSIEADLVHFAPLLVDEDDTVMGLRLEQLVRAYDPCISCATHFLDVEVTRS